MNFTFTSVFNASLFGFVLIGGIYLLGQRRSFLRRMKPSILILLAYIILFRLVFPIEFPFTISVYIKGLLTSIPEFVMGTWLPLFTTGIWLTDLLFAAWIIGFLVALCRYVVSYYRTIKLLEWSNPVEDDRILETIRQISKRIGRDRNFKVVYVPSVTTPMIFGLRRAYIILPETEMPEKDRFYVLYHEMVHYHRKHLYIKAMFAFLICVYWWNPFIYVLNRFVADFLEMEVDDVIAGSLDELERIGYMECLLDKSKIQLRKSIILKNSVTFSKRNTSLIAKRIKLICDRSEQGDDLVFSGVVVAVFLACFILSSTLIFEPYTYDPVKVDNPDPYNVFPSDVEATGSIFCFTDRGTFAIRKENGEFDIYSNFVYVVTVPKYNILLEDEDVRIYDTLEEALDNEK